MTKGPAEIDTAKLSDADAEVAERDAGLIMAKLPSADRSGCRWGFCWMTEMEE